MKNTINWVDKWEHWLERKWQLWRGLLWRWRGVNAGHRFGVWNHVKIAYPSCLSVGNDVSLESNCFLHCLSERGVSIGHHTSLGRNVWLHCGGTPEANSRGFFHIGDFSYIGPYSVMGAGGGIIVGDHVQMGPGVIITAENHRFDNPHMRIDEQEVWHQGVIIEDDCWIGGRVTILDGVHISKGCVVGAGAVVTRSLPPFVVAVGVPARPIGSRKVGEG